jgi:predicted nucleotidyltransferase
MDERRTVDQKTLDDIIRRIVEVAHPEKIILFGSAARGEMGPNSDVDLLIIKRGADALDLSNCLDCQGGLVYFFRFAPPGVARVSDVSAEH